MNKNPHVRSSDYFRIVFPQIIIGLIILISVYVLSMGHGSISLISSSSYFLVFYGLLTLPIFLICGVIFLIKIIGFESAILGGTILVYTLLLPIIFFFCSIFLLRLLSHSEVSTKKLKRIMALHFAVATIAILAVKLCVNDGEKNLPFWLELIWLTFSIILPNYILWGTMFEVSKRRRGCRE